MKGLTSEALVGSVAKRALLGVLAGAEIDGSGGFGLVGHGNERGPLVRTVAEGLAFALSAGAPVVGLAGFDEDGNRGLLRDARGGHEDELQDEGWGMDDKSRLQMQD
jgi:hypothetical protein